MLIGLGVSGIAAAIPEPAEVIRDLTVEAAGPSVGPAVSNPREPLTSSTTPMTAATAHHLDR